MLQTDSTTAAERRSALAAMLRTALTLEAPPLFDGITCAVEGCNRK